MDNLENISSQLTFIKVMLGISLFFQAFLFFQALEYRAASRQRLYLSYPGKYFQ